MNGLNVCKKELTAILVSCSFQKGHPLWRQSIAIDHERCGAGGAGLDRSRVDRFAVKGVFRPPSGLSVCGDMVSSTGGATGGKGGGEGIVSDSLVGTKTELCMDPRGVVGTCGKSIAVGSLCGNKLKGESPGGGRTAGSS